MNFQQLSGLLVLGALGTLGLAQTPFPSKQSDYTRVMTYNIQWFHAGDDAKRISSIKEILDQTKPDIVCVQEIEGRAALRQIFDGQWQIAMADAPDEFQETGVAVRRPYVLESYELVFTAKELDYAFPGKRDVMRAIVKTPSGKTMVVYSHHMKSRSGGRMQTDWQRQMAAGMLASLIANRRDENVVVAGDWNDAPNDASANILESGNVLAKGGDDKNYLLMANVTEELADQDFVTIGLHDLYFGEPGVTAKVPGAKADNDRLRGRDYRFPQDVKVPQTFFDQIFCSPNLFARGAKAYVYDHAPAIRGLSGRVQVSEDETTGARTVKYTEKGTRASDHLPVFADIRIN